MRLLVDVFLSREPRVLVVLDHLQVDQPEREHAEQPRKSEADERAAGPAVPLHLPARWFDNRLDRVFAARAVGGFMRTMCCSAIGTIFR